ncbi:MAG: methyltransferase domain-containing protein [Anaerolineae bacterium]|nr:methyltransferase domain-containing protein [Anaerolineae bacterium]
MTQHDAKKPWYEASFGQEYLELYAHRNAAEARADVQAVLALIAPAKDTPLLDLCCGAGRHLVILREQGFTQLVGLDLSPDLLRVAAEDTGGDVPLVRADMRGLPFREHFATVLSLFTSFGYFTEDEENQAVLRMAYRVLRPGGTLLMDYINRDYIIAHLVPEDEKVLSGRHVRNTRRLTGAGRRVEKTTVVTSETGAQRTYRESVRLFSRAEMRAMLQVAGFVTVQEYGALDGRPFSPDTPRLILRAEKSTKCVALSEV